MRRRVVFLLALGLAACTADQPTEPTTAYEGAALSLSLPPVPAPPTLLTATILGANGAPAHITLGVWEAPVVARVTVRGLLDYSGNPQGYLPGTGQIDAAGRYVGYLNSCSLQLSVRVVGYGFIGGYKGGCPNAPQQVGSFTNYTVVSGEIYADRVTGPPGSCYFGGSPCTAITGVETVEVEPLDGADLAITSTSVKVAPGGSIRVDVTPTPTYLEGVKVPWAFREFRWEGQGPTVGGGQTTGCYAQPAVGECLVAVYQSGFVVAEAIVNGRLKTKKVFVAVIGGDSLPPPPPPDSIPVDTIPTDTIPTDTIPGGGGGGGCNSACNSHPDSVRILGFVVRRADSDSTSFTSLSGENVIEVRAKAFPETFNSQIHWHAVDDSSDAVSTPLPDDGLISSGTTAEITMTSPDTAHWRLHGHPGETVWKHLSFRVTAFVATRTDTVRSGTVTISQDQLDVLRQEYIDLLSHRTSGRTRVPRRAEFSPNQMVEWGINTGDYPSAMYPQSFALAVDSLQLAFQKIPGRLWNLNVIYRNPVHNLMHVDPKYHPNPNSYHMYGCAADLQTYPTSRTAPADSISAETYWSTLSGLATKMGFEIEARDQSGLGHVHVQRKCN